MTGQDIFNKACDLISKRLSNGTIDPNSTAVYRARSLGLITLWQSIMQTELLQTISDPITDLSDEITVVDNITGPYYLAANLIFNEDSDSANYFQQMFEVLKKTVIRKQPAEWVEITDVYGVVSEVSDPW